MSTEAQFAAKPVYQQITSCRLCHSSKHTNIISLGDQYLCDFVQHKDDNLPKAPLELVQCVECGLLQLKHSINRELLYREYWYRSSVNQTMRSALADLVQNGLKYHQDGTWLDIGANDGWTLSRVPESFKKIACEPALNLAEDCAEHADLVISDFFKSQDELKGCDVITSAAMFYDLDDPNSFVRDIARCLSPDGIWINQLSDTVAMMRTNAFDNIVHEHVTYWDFKTLKRLYAEHGLMIVEVSHNDVNGGSIRLVAKKQGQAWEQPVSSVLAHMPSQFAERTRRWKQLMTEMLTETPSFTAEPLFGYGASTKGCCLLQYLDLNDRFIAIADRNPKKENLIMAGTWIPVVSEAVMRRSRPATLIALPYSFKAEFLNREAETLRAGTRFLFPLPSIEIVL